MSGLPRDVRVTLDSTVPEGDDFQRFADAVRALGQAFVDAFTPAVRTLAAWMDSVLGSITPEMRERQRRWNALDPAAKRALTIVHDAVDDADATYQDALADLRRDLLGSYGGFVMRESMWAQAAYGVTEQDVLARCAEVFRLRFMLNLTEDEAASVAVAILGGYTRRLSIQTNGA